MKTFWIFAALLSIVLCSCCCGCAGTGAEASDSPSAQAAAENFSKAADRLADTAWRPVFLIDREDAKMPPEDSQDAVRLQISKDMRVNGYSGDNLFGGELVVLDSGFFKINKMYSTRRAGPYGLYEYKFLSALGRTDRFELSGDTLKLFNGKTLLLEFKRKAK